MRLTKWSESSPALDIKFAKVNAASKEILLAVNDYFTVHLHILWCAGEIGERHKERFSLT